MHFSRRAVLGYVIGLGMFPMAASGWTGNGTPASPYSVDISQRNDVVSFWQSVYKASEGYEARYATGAYVDVQRRVNFVRALCGAPAGVQFNTGAQVTVFGNDAYKPVGTLPTKVAATQQAANMITLTLQTSPLHQLLAFTHNPLPGDCAGWSVAAWNACSKGNLAFGFYGPGAVDSYFREDVANLASENTTVGHRRWLLNLQSTNFATGDFPGGTPGTVANPYAIYPTNCIYVVPNAGELNSAVAAKFVPYPAAGNFPAQLNSPYWSLSYPGATFTANTVVKMRDANGTLLSGVAPQLITPGYGDNAVVWQVPAAAAVKSVSADTRFTVEVSNFTLLGSSAPQSYTYTVNLINPETLTDPQTLTGSSTPLAAGSTNYTFARPASSDAVEVGFFKLPPATWTEGAEASPAPMIIDGTSSAPLISPASNFTVPGFARAGGTKAFRLTFASRYDPVIGGAKDQIFELDRDIVPDAGATLNFYCRRGYMTQVSRLLVETSSDDGVTWVPQGNAFPGNNSGGIVDSAFVSRSVALPASNLLRVRFRLNYAGVLATDTLYTMEEYPTDPIGVFIDDISVANCHWLEKEGSVSPASPLTQAAFSSATAGQTLVMGDTWWLRMRTQMGGHWFPYGPAKIVTSVGLYLPVGTLAPPVAGATYLFDPIGRPTTYTLEVAKIGSTATEGAEAVPPPVTAAVGSYSLVSSAFVHGGTKSFRLAVSPKTDTLDTFTFNRSFVPTATSNLTFFTQRGRMSKTNFLHAEVSTDNGTTWTSIGSQPGAGTTANSADDAMIAQSYSLAAYADQTVKLRFAFRNDDQSAPTAAADTGTAAATSAGVWIDDITMTNVLDPITLTPLAGTANSFRLDATSAGGMLVAGTQYHLRLRAVNGVMPGAWGQSLVVVPTATPLTGYDAWLTYDYPSLAGEPFGGDTDGDGVPNGIEYAFNLDPLTRGVSTDVPVVNEANSTFSISRPLSAKQAGVTYGAEASTDLETWSTAGVIVTVAGGQAVATVPLSSGYHYLRWKITAP